MSSGPRQHGKSDLALWEAEFAAMNAQWAEEHPEEAAKLKQTMAVLNSYWLAPAELRQALEDDPEWAAELKFAIDNLIKRRPTVTLAEEDDDG